LLRDEAGLEKDTPEWFSGILLMRIFRALDVVFGEEAKTWMVNENAAFAERRPIDLIQTTEGLREVCSYVEWHVDVSGSGADNISTSGGEEESGTGFKDVGLGGGTAGTGKDFEIKKKTLTEGERASLSKMLIRLFDLWGLASPERCALLNLSPTSRMMLSRYRKGKPLQDDPDLLDRVGHLLGIHKNLRIIFPNNRDLVYRWVKAPNQRFDGKSPLEIMCKGSEGILFVRRYLDFELGR
jgi:uncharacterized protein (DUF2384 family)